MIQVSALPLLAYKVGPNLFDLSTGMHHASLRDQMHRAVALAEALVDGKQFREVNHVLIVGAGLAGAAAGVVLARHGVDVQIIDGSSDAPFALQRHVNARSVGAYMYEWPLGVHSSQCMPPARHGALAPWDNKIAPPLPFGAADPSKPAALVVDWDAELYRAIASSGGRLRLQVGIETELTNAEVKNWLKAQRRAHEVGTQHQVSAISIVGGHPWRSSDAPHMGLTPRYVLLAAGMGSECTKVVDCNGTTVLEGEPFWKDDNILTPRCGQAQMPRVVVLGGGDGALQDALRAATGDDHPQVTWQKLSPHDRNNVLPPALSLLLTLEAQHAQTIVWARSDALRKESLAVLDGAYAVLAAELAKDEPLSAAVLNLLRRDVQTVHLCVREAYFSKTYALNRFLVHLLEQCMQLRGSPSGRVSLNVWRNRKVKDVRTFSTFKQLVFSDSTQLEAEIVVVRFGADLSNLPGQWLGLEKLDTVNRQELATLPLPLYLPPTR